MKKVGVVFLVGAALALASSARADQITIGDGTFHSGVTYQGYGPFQTGVGGEFTYNIVNPTGWLSLSGYAAVTSNQGSSLALGITSFQTFCIEENEYLYPYDATYNATLTAAAVNGGLGGGSPDPVSKGTGWLYSRFASGALVADGYNYNGTVAQRTASADQLQRTIWWLEDESADPGTSNVFRNAVLSQFTEADAKADGGTAQYGVYAINLWTSNDPAQDRVQDALYYDPRVSVTTVPDRGTTLALLGMALSGIVIVSRRFRSA